MIWVKKYYTKHGATNLARVHGIFLRYLTKQVSLLDTTLFSAMLEDDWCISVTRPLVYMRQLPHDFFPLNPRLSVLCECVCAPELARHTFYKKIKIQKKFKT